MHHSRQPVRVVSSGVRARARKYNTANSSNSYSTVKLDDAAASAEASAPMIAEPVPVYEPSWRRTGRSSMSADVRIPSFLIPCSASQLMDARYKSRKFSRASSDAAKAISPAA
ncbi:hypothetical protein PR003_g15659 [Phytophthora rubi]|uniref:Uncharacterized protein n=1 Tax=Phytophthora rubi TaxID=129364 RepID=A0A6A4ESV8_9STRA|nr:hypothetical protein PR002_g14116 [Phytophthora rubi]KAE9015551.1 hypothetical protein PR001_g14879 [Phytophthora rubi]KAE9329010.1 hypothetical protein PR003_g15659 [Phytophthora rubi]